MADGTGPVGQCAHCEAPYYFDNTKRCWNCGYRVDGSEGPPADLAFLMSTPEFDTAVGVTGSAVNLGEVRRQVAERERRADNCVPCLNIQPGRYGMPFQCTEPRGHDDYHKADCLGYKVIAWPIETESNDE